MTEGRSDGGSSPPTNGGGGGGGKSGGNVTTGKDKASPCSAGSPIKAIPVDLTMAAGQLLGPFHDPLQWIRVKYAESATLTTPLDLQSLDSGCFELFRNVEIARNSSEQNLEIVLDEGQFYFRSLFELEANVNRKLYAWFSGDLSDKLPSPLIQTINGTKRYMCGLCSQLFTNPNPVVVHVLFSCPRRHEYLPGSERPKEQPVKLTPSPKDSSTSVHSILATEVVTGTTVPTKKRGFDIASLVEKDENVSSEKRRKHGPKDTSNTSSPFSSNIATSNGHSFSGHGSTNCSQNSYTESKSAFRAPVNPTASSIKSHLNSSMSNLSSTLLTSLQSSQLNGSLAPTTLSHNQSSFLSAFKKVQAKADLLPTSGPTSFDITSLYGSRPLAASQPSLFAGHSQLAYSLMPPPGSLMSPSLSSTTQAPSGHPMKSNGGPSLSQLNQISPSGRPGHDSKSLVAPSLLPFLPPSLAALSFPQTNWCAKCNATFRMTSDLVYHMRSHHKSNTIVDPIKKKREEKLRCNVCGESFRERHHLTRHMTSHQ